jgi:AcrR family transcriptional regulator
MSDRVITSRHRARNAAATRAAILAAARAHFAADSYERVGVREIAAAAGVDPALVIRYFGSKDGLLREALHQGGDLIPLLDADRATAGERLARLVLLKDKGADGADWLLVLLRSAANEEAGSALRDAVEGQFIRPLAVWLGGEQAQLRASLIVAYVLGLMIGRTVLRTEGLATGSIEELVALIGPVLQAYIDGEPVAPRGNHD